MRAAQREGGTPGYGSEETHPWVSGRSMVTRPIGEARLAAHTEAYVPLHIPERMPGNNLDQTGESEQTNTGGDHAQSYCTPGLVASPRFNPGFQRSASKPSETRVEGTSDIPDRMRVSICTHTIEL